MISHLALLLAAFIYGANYSIAKYVLDGDYIQPRGFIFYRILAGLILVTFFHLVLVRQKIEKKDLLLVAMCGLFGVAINQTFFFEGLKRTVPIHAALIMTTTPVLVLILSIILKTEIITRWKTLGIFIGLGGATYLITNGGESFLGGVFWGDLLIFINATSYGIYLILVRDLLKKYHPFTIMKWMFLFGLIYVIPFSWHQAIDVDWQAFTPALWASFAYVLIFTTFLAYSLNQYALKTLASTVVSSYIYLQPILASFFAIASGMDKIDHIKIIAGILIFTGVYLSSKKLSEPITRAQKIR